MGISVAITQAQVVPPTPAAQTQQGATVKPITEEKPEQPTIEQPIEQPVAQTATQNSLAANIGGFLTLGTGNVWLGILLWLIILAIIIYAIYLLRKRKDSGGI